MAIGPLVAGLLAAAGCVALWQRKRDAFSLATGLFMFGLIAYVVARDGIEPSAIAGPVGGAVTLTAAAMAFLMWTEVLGLPRGLALLLGIGLVSRALVFSNRLREEVEALRVLFQQPSHPERRAAVADQAQRHVLRLRSARAPDRAWARLRDEIADSYQVFVDLVRADAPVDEFAEPSTALKTSFASWKDMAHAAAADQRRLATPARRRRGFAVFLGTVGIALLTIGLAEVSAGNLTGRATIDLRQWLTLSEVVVGVALLAGAVIYATRGLPAAQASSASDAGEL
jgi:hypothetical protein